MALGKYYYGNTSISYDTAHAGTAPYYTDSQVGFYQSNDKIMDPITALGKRLFNADTKKLIKAGLLNRDLSLTERGRVELNALLLQQCMKDMVKVADEILDDTE